MQNATGCQPPKLVGFLGCMQTYDISGMVQDTQVLAYNFYMYATVIKYNIS